MNRCEVTMIFSQSQPDKGYQCAADSMGVCEECAAEVCKNHGQKCFRCGLVICDDWNCSHPHEVICRSLFENFNAKIAEVTKIVDRRLGNA